MIIKKSELKNTIVTTILSMVVLIIVTGIFKLYHDSNYVKSEYDRICPQNYGDPVSLDRCYWPYKLEGATLQTALEGEIAALVIAPVIIFLLTLI